MSVVEVDAQRVRRDFHCCVDLFDLVFRFLQEWRWERQRSRCRLLRSRTGRGRGGWAGGRGYRCGRFGRRLDGGFGWRRWRRRGRGKGWQLLLGFDGLDRLDHAGHDPPQVRRRILERVGEGDSRQIARLSANGAHLRARHFSFELDHLFAEPELHRSCRVHRQTIEVLDLRADQTQLGNLSFRRIDGAVDRRLERNAFSIALLFVGLFHERIGFYNVPMQRIGLVFLSLVLASPAFAQSDDVSAARAVFEANINAIRQKNLDAYLSYYLHSP